MAELCNGICSSQQQDVEVFRSEVKLSFTPESLSKEISPSVSVLIQPVSPEKINQECFIAANKGKWDEEIMLSKQYVQSLNRKIDRKGKVNIGGLYDYIVSLNQEGYITADISNAFIDRAFRRKGYTGLENLFISDDSTISQRSNEFNPFSLKGLSLLKIKISNHSNKIYRIQDKDLLIQNGYIQSFPIPTKYFDTIFSGTSETYKNVLRFNFPNELIVPSGQEIIKYLCIPEIDESSEILTVSIINNDQAIIYPFNVQFSTEKRKYLVYPYTFNVISFLRKPFIYIVIKLGEQVIPLSNYATFNVRVEDLDLPLDIYCWAFTNNGCEFGWVKNVSFRSYQRQQIRITTVPSLQSFKQRDKTL